MAGMDGKVIWNIRDSRGLTTNEKVFLYTVASRGIAKSMRKTLMDDTGLSTGAITKVVRSLQDKGLLTVHPGRWEDKKRTPTQYSVNKKALEEWKSVHVVNTLEADSVHEVNDSVHVVNRVCSRGGDKGNSKENKKVNTSEAAASPESSPSMKMNEDDGPSLMTDKADRFLIASQKKERGKVTGEGVCSPHEHTNGHIDYRKQAEVDDVAYYFEKAKAIPLLGGGVRSDKNAYILAMKKAGKEVKK